LSVLHFTKISGNGSFPCCAFGTANSCNYLSY
jgi:hypothetical protein